MKTRTTRPGFGKRGVRRTSLIVLGAIAASMLVGVLPASARPTRPICENPGWRFAVSSNAVGGRFGHVGPWHVNYNATGSKATTTLTSTETGSVTDSVSVSVTAEASAFVFAKVSATIDGSISHSKSVSTSNSISFQTPSHNYGNGGYGYFKTAVTGKLYYLRSDCNLSPNYGSVTFKYPQGSVGWCIWNSTASEGPLGDRPLGCSP